MLDPIIMQSIKHENIIPNGGETVAPDDKTGVHKNTKIYMQDSMILWINPRSNILRLDNIRWNPSL